MTLVPAVRLPDCDHISRASASQYAGAHAIDLDARRVFLKAPRRASVFTIEVCGGLSVGIEFDCLKRALPTM